MLTTENAAGQQDKNWERSGYCMKNIQHGKGKEGR